MSYPTFVRAYLQTLGGSPCGTLQQRLEWDSGASVPTYVKVLGAGDFTTAICCRMDLGSGNYTWKLTLMRISGTCAGLATFHRSPAADDPVGIYCRFDGTQLDCDAGQLSVLDDD